MTIVAPLILPRPKKTPSRLSVAVDPFVEPWIKPKTLAKVGVAAAALRWALSKDLVAFLASYNAALATRPFQTKAIGTGVTYFASDLTAQSLEGDESVPLRQRLGRALRFAVVGGLWVGPLLAAWFTAMDAMIPGNGAGAVISKVVMDQVIQGPLMIGSMFVLVGLLAGGSLRDGVATVRTRLWDVWVKSVYVWAPVQAVQQLVVPLQYRVAVANLVSYFWDTYMASEMAEECDVAKDIAYASR